MLQNPSKYHPNPLTHFLALHNSATQQHQHQQQSISIRNSANTSLDVGKSFTIAAILGLQKNVIEQRDYGSVMNLSINSHHLHQKSNNNLASQLTNSICSNSNGNNTNSDNCDSITAVNNVVNRFLPTNPNNHQMRINHFATGAPSALQSLQQLHHAQQASLGFQRDVKHKNDGLSSKKSALKNKRVRTIFTPEQLERLEAEFERQQYMVGPERLYLAHTLQLTEAQVKVWFQNRRIKWRKTHLEVTQQRLALIRQNQISNDDGTIDNNDEPDVEITNDLSSLNNSNVSGHQQSESDLSICNDSIDSIDSIEITAADKI